MTFTIPDANGLAQELSERVKDKKLSTSQPIEKQAANPPFKVRTIDVLVNDEVIGTVTTVFYEIDRVRHIDHLTYEGRIPGYINPSTGKEEINMQAAEHRKERPFYRRLKSVPNNTPERPLCRIDGHQTIRFADHEVDGSVEYAGYKPIYPPKDIVELKK